MCCAKGGGYKQIPCISSTKERLEACESSKAFKPTGSRPASVRKPVHFIEWGFPSNPNLGPGGLSGSCQPSSFSALTSVSSLRGRPRTLVSSFSRRPYRIGYVSSLLRLRGKAAEIERARTTLLLYQGGPLAFTGLAFAKAVNERKKRVLRAFYSTVLL